jgi:hypothetical protein
MTEDRFMFKCGLCGRSYQHGPHRYEGHRLKPYGNLFACDPCWQGNHDGWAPHYEPVLLAELQRQGLAVPPRNAKGFLPRE